MPSHQTRPYSRAYEDDSEQLARLLQEEEDRRATEEFLKKGGGQQYGNRPTEEEDARLARELQEQYDRDTLANPRSSDFHAPTRLQPTHDRRPANLVSSKSRSNADAWLTSDEVPIYDSDYPDATRPKHKPYRQPAAEELDDDEMLQAAILESAKQSQLQKNPPKRPR